MSLQIIGLVLVNQPTVHQRPMRMHFWGSSWDSPNYIHSKTRLKKAAQKKLFLMIALNYRLLNLDIEIVSRLHEVDLTLNVEKTDKNYRLSAVARSLDSGINVRRT